ncbi:MAG: hypothetical protein EXX96DRAFT_592340 [Benjaminiella poitrasii]|nr:MAG: hypothetical protein EXX96DRAFT_592340 [Benjaminiella poitrasii]
MNNTLPPLQLTKYLYTKTSRDSLLPTPPPFHLIALPDSSSRDAEKQAKRQLDNDHERRKNRDERRSICSYWTCTWASGKPMHVQDDRGDPIAVRLTGTRPDCLRTLVAADVLGRSSEALELAVQQRKIDLVRYLRRDVAVEPCRLDGSTRRSSMAVRHGFVDMIPLLLTSETSSDCLQQASHPSRLHLTS